MNTKKQRRPKNYESDQYDILITASNGRVLRSHGIVAPLDTVAIQQAALYHQKAFGLEIWNVSKVNLKLRAWRVLDGAVTAATSRQR